MINIKLKMRSNIHDSNDAYMKKVLGSPNLEKKKPNQDLETN